MIGGPLVDKHFILSSAPTQAHLARRTLCEAVGLHAVILRVAQAKARTSKHPSCIRAYLVVSRHGLEP